MSRAREPRGHFCSIRASWQVELSACLRPSPLLHQWRGAPPPAPYERVSTRLTSPPPSRRKRFLAPRTVFDRVGSRSALRASSPLLVRTVTFLRPRFVDRLVRFSPGTHLDALQIFESSGFFCDVIHAVVLAQAPLPTPTTPCAGRSVHLAAGAGRSVGYGPAVPAHTPPPAVAPGPVTAPFSRHPGRLGVSERRAACVARSCTEVISEDVGIRCSAAPRRTATREPYMGLCGARSIPVGL
jgi:hypothetical protein